MFTFILIFYILVFFSFVLRNFNNAFSTLYFLIKGHVLHNIFLHKCVRD